ncbi:glycosyltransferase family 2 protein [Candidatus Daviesbacteria bacterium]|nr:glycosyltransferase family 2 protein [Candidatus Daviesbacteria bacterium]
MVKAPDLSIIILNYNVKELLLNCLESIFKNKGKEDKWQVVVVDNASIDGSVEAVKQLRSHMSSGNTVDIIENRENMGFANGNNVAIPKVKAPVVLFLNPDTKIVGDVIQKCLDKLLSNPDLGAISPRVELPDGRLDYSCHRGFPTPWNSLMYFSGISKLFPKIKLFSGYTASYLDTQTEHEIDCITGAFLMVRKIAGDQIHWWDKDYFFNGEDIEFCFSLKEKGWEIYYYPKVKIIHYKGSSSGLWSTAKIQVSKESRLKSAKHSTGAMRIFYMKHYYKKYPVFFRDLVLLGIKSLEHYRKAKIWISR